MSLPYFQAILARLGLTWCASHLYNKFSNDGASTSLAHILNGGLY